MPRGEKKLNPEWATEEACRCLGSQVCDSCDVCSLLCPDLCITRDPVTGKILIDYDYCKGCGICAVVCPKGAITMVLEDETDR
jgi:2-oxoacid:acceptor oxidoreductase delta subunit (pyruvate/2-ketoisovalerate family)